VPNFEQSHEDELRQLLHRLIGEEQGQDLIEYALLTGAIGFCAVAAFNALGGAINTTYTSWVGGANSLWETPNPAP
jgi:Flp pilus assembly pilin Flp